MDLFESFDKQKIEEVVFQETETQRSDTPWWTQLGGLDPLVIKSMLEFKQREMELTFEREAAHIKSNTEAAIKNKQLETETELKHKQLETETALKRKQLETHPCHSFFAF